MNITTSILLHIKEDCLDMEAVWLVANERIPELFQYVEKLLAILED